MKISYCKLQEKIVANQLLAVCDGFVNVILEYKVAHYNLKSPKISTRRVSNVEIELSYAYGSLNLIRFYHHRVMIFFIFFKRETSIFRTVI